MVEEWWATFHTACHASCPGTTLIARRPFTVNLPLLHDQLGPPVLCPALLGFIGRHGLLLAIAVGADAAVGASSGNHNLLHRDGPVERELLVSGRISGVIRMAFKADRHV